MQAVKNSIRQVKVLALDILALRQRRDYAIDEMNGQKQYLCECEITARFATVDRLGIRDEVLAQMHQEQMNAGMIRRNKDGNWVTYMDEAPDWSELLSQV